MKSCGWIELHSNHVRAADSHLRGGGAAWVRGLGLVSVDFLGAVACGTGGFCGGLGRGRLSWGGVSRTALGGGGVVVVGRGWTWGAGVGPGLPFESGCGCCRGCGGRPWMADPDPAAPWMASAGFPAARSAAGEMMTHKAHLTVLRSGGGLCSMPQSQIAGTVGGPCGAKGPPEARVFEGYSGDSLQQPHPLRRAGPGEGRLGAWKWPWLGGAGGRRGKRL